MHYLDPEYWLGGVGVRRRRFLELDFGDRERRSLGDGDLDLARVLLSRADIFIVSPRGIGGLLTEMGLAGVVETPPPAFKGSDPPVVAVEMGWGRSVGSVSVVSSRTGLLE